MLYGAHSQASDLVKWITPALEALYANCGCGWLTMTPDMEPIKMIEPGLPAATNGWANWNILTEPSGMDQQISNFIVMNIDLVTTIFNLIGITNITRPRSDFRNWVDPLRFSPLA
ncbi:hypothetical protein WICPIJ_000953 [Wickerhamomyces pijperi]|uniref:Uncharacterized protein n=1 Tax=Wickerhamomyces pijperi TaxID=599730 RepID=A0A9P8QEU3_WICPI|nr:hypothetical protein WICPIJ_000953 [Wickerhamomyces pijperi]